MPVFGSSCGLKLTLDPELGHIISLEREDDFEIEPSQKRIAPEEAQRIASVEAQKLDGIRAVVVSSPELGYVMPAGNGAKYPHRLRLGWRMSTSGLTYEVAVDAETGEVLGTRDTKLRPPPGMS